MKKQFKKIIPLAVILLVFIGIIGSPTLTYAGIVKCYCTSSASQSDQTFTDTDVCRSPGNSYTCSVVGTCTDQNNLSSCTSVSNQCPSGQVYDASVRTCIGGRTGNRCSEGLWADYNTGQCVSSCPSGQLYDWDSGSCSNQTDCQSNGGNRCTTTSTGIPNTSNNLGGNLSPYVPLEPLPGFIPTDQTDFGRYINQMFKVIIAVGAIIAVGSLVFSGIVYMVSGAVGTKSAALKRIHATLWGLLLLIASWLLLYTINPRLVGQAPSTTAITTTDNSMTSQVLPPTGQQVYYPDSITDAQYQQILTDCGGLPIIQDRGTDTTGAWVTYTCL